MNSDEEMHNSPSDGDDNNATSPRRRAHVPKMGAGKLWGKAEYPEGCVPLQSCWDMENLRAAQNWSCPCKDLFDVPRTRVSIRSRSGEADRAGLSGIV